MMAKDGNKTSTTNERCMEFGPGSKVQRSKQQVAALATVGDNMAAKMVKIKGRYKVSFEQRVNCNFCREGQVAVSVYLHYRVMSFTCKKTCSLMLKDTETKKQKTDNCVAYKGESSLNNYIVP